MITTIRYVRTLAVTTRPVTLRVVRYDGPVGIPRRHSQRPAWSVLCAIVLLALVVLWASDYLLPDGLARSLGDLLAVFGCIGLTRLWLGANRCSLVRRAAKDQEVDQAPVNEKARSGGASSRSASLWVGQ